MSGPLTGTRVVELAGIGPTPFAGMMLSDMGAEVIRIDRVGATPSPVTSLGGAMERGKKSVALDLKSEKGVAALLKIVATADVLVEGFRAGVAERLGIGPKDCHKVNPDLVYARMTGWGQEGPLANRAGHDINYISLAGPLAHIGRKGQAPSVPLNLIGDFGGGSIFLVLGICAALFNVAKAGDKKSENKGQVVDAAMVDGAAYLMSPLFSAYASDFWGEERGTNLLDSGAHFYDVYETSDEKYMAVGAIEPQFYAELIKGLGLTDEEAHTNDYFDKKVWPELKEKFTEIFLTKTQAEWVQIFEDTDACTTPVLTMDETPEHIQSKERNAHFEIAGVTQPSPAPRWSTTPAEPSLEIHTPGQDTDDVLEEVGFSKDDISSLRSENIVG